MLGHLLNAWIAVSPLAGGLAILGITAVVLSVIGIAWIPAEWRHLVACVGGAVAVAALVYQIGLFRGAHEAFRADANRAIRAEAARVSAARKVTEDLAAQATSDLAAARDDAAQLKVLLDDANKRADAGRVCVPKSVGGRLRNL